MSLVAYGSSDDSDSETSVTPGIKPSAGGLFSLLPAPKKPSSVGRNDVPSKETKPKARDSDSIDDLAPQLSKGGLFSTLPKPKKRSEPVRITVPQIQRQDVRILMFAETLLMLVIQVVMYNLCFFSAISQTQTMMNRPGKNTSLG